MNTQRVQNGDKHYPASRSTDIFNFQTFPVILTKKSQFKQTLSQNLPRLILFVKRILTKKPDRTRSSTQSADTLYLPSAALALAGSDVGFRLAK